MSVRPLLIVNPTSGRRGAASLRRVLEEAETALGPLDVRETARQGHAVALARRAAEESRALVVAVGGDGTLSEVAGGLLSAGVSAGDLPRLGFIVRGMGGDFRRSLGLGKGTDTCLAAIVSGRERPIDAARATVIGAAGEPVERYFVNVLSAGMGGLVDRYVARQPDALGGRLSYLTAALRALAACKHAHLRCRATWAGATVERVVPAYVLAVCNGRRFGAGMRVAPMAAIDDGRLEVVAISAANKRVLLRKVPTIYTGRHILEPTVTHFPCTRVAVELADDDGEPRAADYPLDIDGEALGQPPFTVEVLPGALTLRA